MKKFISTILTIITVLGFTISLAGCNNSDPDPYEYTATESGPNFKKFMLMVADYDSEFFYGDELDVMKDYVSCTTNVNGYFLLEYGEEFEFFIPKEENIVISQFYYNEQYNKYYVREYFSFGTKNAGRDFSTIREDFVDCIIFPVENYAGQDLRYEFGGGRLKGKQYKDKEVYSRYINVYFEENRIACIDIGQYSYMADIPQRWWINYLDKYLRWVQIDEG